MNAQISILDGSYNLIHIPLELYSSFLQPILQVLLPLVSAPPVPDNAGPPSASSLEAQLAGLTVEDQHTFLNISVTPLECSVVCHRHWSGAVFEPAIARLPPDQARRVSVSRDEYLVLCVMSVGMDVGGRVVELTSPLAMAGIPIFFITTYYSDFILVPAKDRRAVLAALVARGFDFSDSAAAATVVPPTSSSSHHGRGSSQGEAVGPPPGTPPPSSTAELQKRTFELLRRRSVVPFVEPGLRLVQCSGHSRPKAHHHHHGHHYAPQHHQHHRPSLSRTTTGTDSLFATGDGAGGAPGGGGGSGGGWAGGAANGALDNTPAYSAHLLDALDARLYVGLVAALASSPATVPPVHHHRAASPATTATTTATASSSSSPAPPRFLSITLAAGDAPSLLLDRGLLPCFGGAVAGDLDDELVPIFLDLETLPFEATGIVSGVAGGLAEVMKQGGGGEGGGGGGAGGGGGGGAGGEGKSNSELSYLSTARAGAVILSSDLAGRALEGLLPLLVATKDP